MNQKLFCWVLFVCLVLQSCQKDKKEEISEEKVVGWGENIYGELDIPVDLIDAKMVVAGDNFSLALKKDGTVVGWGKNDKGQIDIPIGLKDVTTIVSGGDYSIAIKSDGSLAGWGANVYEQLNFPPYLSNVVQILAYNSWVLALKSNGEIESWGLRQPIHLPINSFKEIKEIAVSLDQNVIVGLKADGTVINEALDAPIVSNLIPLNLTGVEHVTIDNGHFAFLQIGSYLTVIGKSDGGFNQYIEVIGDVKDMFSGYNKLIILKQDGTLITRGQNYNNALDLPQGLIDVSKVSIGTYHSLAIGKIKK